jgi:RimJ/RimL family protein N-acetyltransferase
MITEEDFVDFKCPYCMEMVSFPKGQRGAVRECPNCMESMIAPKDGEVGRTVPLPVDSPRLTLRRLASSDCQDLLGWNPETDEEQMLAWLDKDSGIRLTTADQTFFLAIELKETTKVIGYLGLRFTDAERVQATLEVSLDAKYEGTDYAVEAVDAWIGFCFVGLGLHRVSARCDATDAARRRLFEEAGMRREAEFVKDRLVEGEWVNSVWFGALEEEYERE